MGGGFAAEAGLDFLQGGDPFTFQVPATSLGEQRFRHEAILNAERIPHRRAEISFNLCRGRHAEKLIAIGAVVNHAGQRLYFFLYICSGVRSCGSVVLNVSPWPSMERKKQEL